LQPSQQLSKMFNECGAFKRIDRLIRSVLDLADGASLVQSLFRMERPTISLTLPVYRSGGESSWT